MRILILNYEFPPLGGGAGNATYYLLKEFAKEADLKIDLVTSSVDSFGIEKFSDNINIHFLDIGKKGNLHYQSNKDLLSYSWKAYWYSKKLMKQADYDLCHAFFGIPCGFIAMLLGKPYLVSLRGSDVPFYNKRFYWLDKFVLQYVSKIIWKKSRVVVANSQGLKNLSLKTDPKQVIAVIYNGIDAEQFCPVAKHSDEFTIISTSRLIKRKGIEYLLSAFIDFKKRYICSRLIIVGDGDLKDDFVNMINASAVEESVEFLGSVKHSNLPDIYRRADVFVLPSLNEGMSNSLLEAMASGLAIVATSTGGTEELVDGVNGIIVNKNSATEIYNALEKLYSNKEVLDKMKVASREKSLAINWTNIMHKYLRIYEQI